MLMRLRCYFAVMCQSQEICFRDSLGLRRQKKTAISLLELP